MKTEVDKNKINIGASLRNLMLIKNINQRQLAVKIGLTESRISKLKTVKNCNLKNLVEFAEIFEVSVDEFLKCGETDIKKNAATEWLKGLE